MFADAKNPLIRYHELSDDCQACSFPTAVIKTHEILLFINDCEPTVTKTEEVSGCQ